jgi:hypothetical protein
VGGIKSGPASARLFRDTVVVGSFSSTIRAAVGTRADVPSVVRFYSISGRRIWRVGLNEFGGWYVAVQ